MNSRSCSSIPGSIPRVGVLLEDLLPARRSDLVAAKGHRPGRIPGLEVEGRWGLRRHLHDEAAVEAHPHAVHRHPGLAKELARPVMQEVDPDLLEDRHRLLVDRLDVLTGQDVVRLEAVLPHGGQSCITREKPRRSGGPNP